MIRRSAVLLTALVLTTLSFAASASAAEEACELEPRSRCFGVESLSASLSMPPPIDPETGEPAIDPETGEPKEPQFEPSQAGAHPDLHFSFDIKRDPESDPNVFGLKNAFAPTRDVRIELPPGLLGDPSVLGATQQCSAVEAATYEADDPNTVAIEGGCPNTSQVGNAQVFAYQLNSALTLPVYMMQPPGGDIVARIGIIVPGVGAMIFIDGSVRTEDDYGLTLEVVDSPTAVKLLRTVATTWGVPTAKAHDHERCTPQEVLLRACVESVARDPRGVEKPFITNPTRCGAPIQMRVGASSWVEPLNFDFKKAPFPEITGCNNLPFGPRLTIEPTNHRAAAPTGLDITATLPASTGPNVLEPAQTRNVRVALPQGMVANSSAADGLGTCSEDQVHYEDNVAADCPESSKVADFEALIPALPRKVKGALFLREPEPGNLFRVWLVADDQGIHVKLPGQLVIDKQTGQITTQVLEVPQAPLREMKIVLKSGFRAPLANPSACGNYATQGTFTPWSGGPPQPVTNQIAINQGCATGGFNPSLSAGATNPTAGAHSTFLFTLNREDGEQNPASLNVTLPQGLAATLAGVPRCEGAAAAVGSCPPASQIGRVLASAGAGPAPLWVPQPGKRPTAVYLGGAYKGAPLSVVAVVPAQAGPFDLGDQVVRSAINLDPATAQASVSSDPLPQILEGVPIQYRTVQVLLDRPGFALNPTGCEPKTIETTITSTSGAQAHPSAPYTAANCAGLGFKPRLGLRLFGGTSRGGHPSFRAVLQPRKGDSNISRTVVRLPHSAFLDQSHIRTVCTRVQYKAGAGNGTSCPAGSIYGHITAFSPLLDEPLSGPVILRSSSHLLPDLVFSLRGLINVEAAGRIDSVNGGVRATFPFIPDAPISKAIIKMQGGKKGLIENSRNLCLHPARARVQLGAHNGRRLTLKPKMKTKCKGKKKRAHKRHRPR